MFDFNNQDNSSLHTFEIGLNQIQLPVSWLACFYEYAESVNKTLEELTIQARKTISISLPSSLVSVAYIVNPFKPDNCLFFLYVKNKQDKVWPLKMQYYEYQESGADFKSSVSLDIIKQARRALVGSFQTYLKSTAIYCVCQLVSVAVTSLTANKIELPWLQYVIDNNANYVPVRLLPKETFKSTDTPDNDCRIAWALSKDQTKFLFIYVKQSKDRDAWIYEKINHELALMEFARPDELTNDVYRWPTLEMVLEAHSQFRKTHLDS